MTQCYEVYAIKYASVQRIRQSNFLLPIDGDPDAPMALDFFIWVVKASDRVILVDTGFSPISALVRNRQYLLSPIDALQKLGIDPVKIKDLVITHLHYDHAGNIPAFPNARVWVQEREISYATGKCMCDPAQSHFYSANDVGSLVERLYKRDVQLIDGYYKLADGVELHQIGGHTAGLQIVKVQTASGPVVLASDAAHYVENLEKKNPFPAIFSMEDMLSGYDYLVNLAEDNLDRIIPGHDPIVCSKYPRLPIEGLHAYQIA